MGEDIEIRTFRPTELEALVVLINQVDAYDKLERGTTQEELEQEMSWPNYQAETDCFLAWAGDALVGFADLFLRKPSMDNGTADAMASVFYTWGVVHPDWRRRGLGRRLMDRLWQRALARMDERERGPVYFQASGQDTEEDRRALFEGLGLLPVRYFVDLARPVSDGLPPLKVPAGYRLRTFDPARDVETAWRVDNESFRDHWGFTGFPLEEFRAWVAGRNCQPRLWFLAEEEASGRVVGLGLNKIDPEWIARTGRQEGYVNTLGVLPEHRRHGLGTALLVRSLYAFKAAGLESAHLHADAENLSGAMRLYERVGFRVRKANIAYRKVMRQS